MVRFYEESHSSIEQNQDNTGDGSSVIQETALPLCFQEPLVLPDQDRLDYWLVGDDPIFITTDKDNEKQDSLSDFYTLPQGAFSPQIHDKENEFVYPLEGETFYQQSDEFVTATSTTFVYKHQDDATVSDTITLSRGTEIPVELATKERSKTVFLSISDSGTIQGQKIDKAVITDSTNGNVALLQDGAILTLENDNSSTLTNGNKPGKSIKTQLKNEQERTILLERDEYTFVAITKEQEGKRSHFHVYVPPNTENEPLISAPTDKGDFIIDRNVSFEREDRSTATPNTLVLLTDENSYTLTNQETQPARTLMFPTVSQFEASISTVDVAGNRLNRPTSSIPEPSVTLSVFTIVALAIVSIKKKYRARSRSK